jgi:hypothetical protein
VRPTCSSSPAAPSPLAAYDTVRAALVPVIAWAWAALDDTGTQIVAFTAAGLVWVALTVLARRRVTPVSDLRGLHGEDFVCAAPPP